MQTFSLYTSPNDTSAIYHTDAISDRVSIHVSNQLMGTSLLGNTKHSEAYAMILVVVLLNNHDYLKRIVYLYFNQKHKKTEITH